MSSRALANQIVQVSTDAKARPTITAFTTISAAMNMPHGERSRGSLSATSGELAAGAVAGESTAGGVAGGAAAGSVAGVATAGGTVGEGLVAAGACEVGATVVGAVCAKAGAGRIRAMA